MKEKLVLDFSEIGLEDVARVGGKNSSLGELYRRMRPLGVNAVDGFATTAAAFRQFLNEELTSHLRVLFDRPLDSVEVLAEVGAAARCAILDAPMPRRLVTEIEAAYDRLFERLGYTSSLAVRSSATAEDLPGASFAGQHDTYLNVAGKRELVEAVRKCMASLFTDRAIDYRIRNGFDHFQVALSVGVQPMVRSDEGAAGVIFTLDPESGFRDVVVISGAYGLGETVVQGSVNPDEWSVFKPTMSRGRHAIVGRRRGSKETKLVFNSDFSGTALVDVPEADRKRMCLQDEEVVVLARWARSIEEHYGRPMDIEWAKDGVTKGLYILQARPETVHAKQARHSVVHYGLLVTPTEPLVTGQSVGEQIATGPVRIVRETQDLAAVQPGDVLVARSTRPDWEPVMKKVAAIVTDEGGRTAHAAIVSREIGVPCVVGAGEATSVLHEGDVVTVSCAEGTEGRVYAGKIAFERTEVELSDVPKTRTQLMVNLGDPARAFEVAGLPVAGVGLARIEFIVNDAIGIHPMALCRFPYLQDRAAVEAIRERLNGEDPTEYFVRRLSEGIATLAAAFYPRPVIVRTSDFKTNEYARLLGGAEFEPSEENPMLGFRGASRYYDRRYADGFRLECMALRRVRNEMGLTNMKVMIPFCRTVAEAAKVVDAMEANGLPRGDGLEIYMMCEVPSNVLDADSFLEIFDGYSIGSNDLTQLALGIDRDSSTVAGLFDENDFAVKSLIAMAIEAAHRASKPIGICGQAPSDDPDFAAWLVRHGIDSISLNPDSVLRTIESVANAERPIKSKASETVDGARASTA